MNFLLRSNQSKKTCFLSRVVLIGVLWCERHHGMDIKTWGKWILHQLVIIALPCSGTIAERSPLSAHIMVQCVLLFMFCLWIILGPVSPSWLCDPLFFLPLTNSTPPPEKSLEICTKYYFWVKGEVIEAWLTPEETYTTRKLLYLFSRAWSVCVLYYGHFLLSIPWLLCNYWKYPHTTKLRVWPKVEGQRHWRFLKMLLPPNP